MKRFAKFMFCITAIIIISILFCLICYADGEAPISPSTSAVMKEQKEIISVEDSPTPSENIEQKSYYISQYMSKASEDFLWETLNKYLDNEKIVAGIMGFFYRESKMRSDAIAGWATRDARAQYDTSQKFTEEVDAGLSDGSTKDYFIEYVHIHFGGYGLGQWLSKKYLNAFYDFAQEWGTSIADAEMQCAFMAWSIENQTTDVWEDIQNMNDILSIGRRIGYGYDGTGYAGSETIASAAQGYYKKYGTK